MDDENHYTALVQRHGVEDLKIYHERKKALDELCVQMKVALGSIRDGTASFREKLAKFGEVYAMGYRATEEIQELESSGMLDEINFISQPLVDATAAPQDFMLRAAHRAAEGCQTLREQQAICEMRDELNQISESQTTLNKCVEVKSQLLRDLEVAEIDLTRWSIINIKSMLDAEAVQSVCGRKAWAIEEILILRGDGLSEEEMGQMEAFLAGVLKIKYSIVTE